MQSTQDWSDGMYSFFYFATLLGLIGEKKWDEFVKAFLKNTQPAVFACYHNMQKYVSRGDYAIGLPLPLIKVGWEVETLALSDVPKTASMRSIGIVKEAAHQKNAETFRQPPPVRRVAEPDGQELRGLGPDEAGRDHEVQRPVPQPDDRVQVLP